MRKQIIASVLIALSLPMLAYAEDTYRPALFDFTGKQLIEKIDTSELASSSVLLYCQSEITHEGLAVRNYCYNEEGNEALIGETEQALKALPFRSAQVNGKNIPVRFSYRVGYRNTDTGLAAVLIPNLGTMQSRYGRDYIAPQERLDVSDWYEKYSKNSWVNGEVFLGEGAESRIAVTVNDEGKADIVRLLDYERGYKRDASIVKNAVKKSRFIPGFVGDKPVPMGYLAVVNYGDGGAMVSKK